MHVAVSAGQSDDSSWSGDHFPVKVAQSIRQCAKDGSGAAPLVSPAAGSDVVLAMRSDAQAELRLVYRVEREAAPAETVTIGLAKDYHYKNSGVGLWISDYRLHRIFRVQPESGLINDSLYAEAWVRGAELENRNANAGPG
jgi:hypothetical protein